ncbi:LamG-like jellyroll fold domain-containing protein [Cellulomonas sp. PhB143]|uniref:LamG-like jellyroll fold domain-containing protein n=1 Tax=Cellulomonas sp. PhB143 TaxID=2485186 RepID=UPI0018F7717F|nr:LamG-like jellyroll fold domain-containing protein [Cellulomonas sp. PhB143]
MVATALTIPLGVGVAVAAAPSSAGGATGAVAPTADQPDLRAGLKGDYFVTTTPDWQLTDANLKATVIDRQIDFGSLTGTFEDLTGRSEQTGARWTGSITPEKSGTYTFYAKGDNGMRLWVDGKQLLDHWVNDWEIEQKSTTITLEAGKSYSFRMDMFQATGGANMHLSWSTDGLEKQVVPASAFSLPEDYDSFPAFGEVDEDGTGLDVTFADEVGGADDLADHVRLTVDGTSWPIDATSASGDVLHADLAAAISRGDDPRFVYDGEGDLTVGGEAVPALNFPVENSSTYRITTPWADDFDKDAPLPEYPRPQLTRDDWQNLNGQWDFAGAEAGDTPADVSYDEKITVPYAVESQLSGIERREDHMFYHRTVEVPEGWDVGDGNRLMLNFGAVDYAATVWVNGTQVGTHEGGYTAFSMDITDALQGTGPQDVVVGVVDTTDGTKQAVGKQTNNPGGIFYTPTSGIWQTVWMEPVPTASVDAVQTTPDIDDGTVALTVKSASASDDATVTAVARDKDGDEVGTVSGAPGEELTLPVPDAHLWSPDDPYLYDVDVTLTDGAASDSVGSYVGMRKIQVTKVNGVNRVQLNNKTTFLMSTLDQGFWPDGLYTPASDEAYKFDIQAHKDLGFNTLRKHIKVEPARFYYHADQMGLMIWQDMPSGWFNDAGVTAQARQTWEAQNHEIIEQHKSVPSIIGWVTFNEGWGEWNLTDTGRIIKSVKAQDPSRLVDGHSGVNCCSSKGDSGQGDMIDYHQYTGPAFPKPDATRAAMDGEHGGFSLSVLGHMWPGGSVNPYGEVTDKASLTKAYVQNTEALVRPAQCYLSGSVYTEISDVEGELNGFYTYDRKVLKMDGDQVRDVNQKVIAAAERTSDDVDPGTPGLKGTGWWNLDEGSGTTAKDSVGGATATAVGNPQWVAGHGGAGSAVKLDGTKDAFATKGPVVDTQNSYSVSAWVQLDKKVNNWATIAAQDDATGNSAFYLQYGNDNGKNVFAFSYEGEPRATYEVDPVGKGWYHVTGVRDSATNTLTLYVNGKQVGQSSVCGGFDPSGPLTIGRGEWHGNPVDYWPGSIDDVRTFDRALSADEVVDVMNGEGAETPDLSVDVTAVGRCVGQNAYVAVRATNTDDVVQGLRLQTPFGSKTMAGVAPGKSASQSFNSRAGSIEGGSVTVTATGTVDGQDVTTDVTADYDAVSCR